LFFKEFLKFKSEISRFNIENKRACSYSFMCHLKFAFSVVDCVFKVGRETFIVTVIKNSTVKVKVKDKAVPVLS